MAFKESLESRRENEQKYNVQQCAKQGCLYLGQRPPYNVWLVEEARNTLNQNTRYNSEVLRPKHLTSINTRVWEANDFGPMGILKDVEIQKNTRLGMKLFKDINPHLPIAEQVQKKYRNVQALFKNFAIVDSQDNIISYSPENEPEPAVQITREPETQIETATELVAQTDIAITTETKVDETVAQEPEDQIVQTTEPDVKDQYSVDQSYQAYFSRQEISHNRMIVLGERQKEIQLAHMFDNNILVIDGGPGTGKTSTMIQRLKLLLSSEFYNDEDFKESDFSNGTSLRKLRKIWNDFLKDKADNNNTWMFFSPTVQLKEFLQNSLSKEGLKYIPESTKVWVERKGRKIDGYCIDLARDFYHFVDVTTDSTPLRPERENEFFQKSPISLYHDFENKLLKGFVESHSDALKELNRLQQLAGIEQPKDISYQPTSFENIFRYSASDCKNTFDDIDRNSLASKAFVKQLSEQLQNELYAACTESIQNDEKCRQYQKNELTPSAILRNMILTRVVLFRFIEKNNHELFDEVFNEEIDLLDSYKKISGILLEAKLSDFKKGFCNTLVKQCNKSDSAEESSYCVNNPYKEQYSDATIITMERLLSDVAQKEGYPLSTIAYLTLFTSVKGAIKRKPIDEAHRNTPWNTYFTENLEAELKRITEKLIWCLIKNYVNNDIKYIGPDFKNSWFLTNKISQAWLNFRNFEVARKRLYTKEDFDILFSSTFKEIYNGFRQENGFDGSYKIQELSFQIYAANTLAQKLYKANRNAFDSLADRNSILYAYKEKARIVIGIDESTDFTPVELAAMASLGHPEYNCITLAGDQMQAFNEKGITNWNQLQSGIFSSPCAIMDLKISYRQSHTLLEMAKKIYKRALGKEAPYNSYVTLPREPAPLLIKSNDRDEKIKWIANRIKSIQQQSKHQPATAIFYPSDSKSEIEEFVEELQDYIAVDSCFDKTVSKIIVYPLSLVKGLEFEAAFFYDLDSIKDSVMQQRYLYVGLSRATFYLGATSSNSWNDDLSRDFETDIQKANWPELR